jgi:hypothetical protein
MTEQDLINQMAALVVNSQAVLQALVNYGTGAGTVTITLLGGQSYTFNTIPAQQATISAQNASDRTAFAANFGGTVSNLALTRASNGKIATTTTTLSNGYVIQQTFTRSGQYNRITSIAVQVYDSFNNLQMNVTKTLTYDSANRLLSIS